MPDHGKPGARCFIAYDIRGVMDTDDAMVFEAMGDYLDRTQVLAELRRENFINLYGPYIVCSYAKERRDDGKDWLIDERQEFMDHGDGQGIYDFASGEYHKFKKKRRRKGRRNRGT
jgi:hypothetical protein